MPSVPIRLQRGRPGTKPDPPSGSAESRRQGADDFGAAVAAHADRLRARSCRATYAPHPCYARTPTPTSLTILDDLLIILAPLLVTRRIVLCRSDSSKEVAEVVKIVLGPLIKRMLVALRTLNADAQERVSKSNRPLFRLAIVIATAAASAPMTKRFMLASSPIRHGCDPGGFALSLSHGDRARNRR